MLYSQSYQNYMTDVRGFSALSARTYGQCLDKFTYWMSLVGIPSDRDVSVIDAARFLAFCTKEQNLCAKTVNLHRSALMGYYSYCTKFHAYPLNPFAECEPLRVEKTLPRWIDEQTINAVVAAFDGGSFESARDKAIILLMAHCGLRCSEVCNLRMEDVTSREVIVHGKGNKWRVVPISRAVSDAISSYREKRVSIVSPWLFLMLGDRQITRAAIFSIVRRAFINSCPSECCHPHALRHSFATICMLHNVPISSISHWMGHASESTTLKYMALVSSNENPFDKF